MDQVKLNRFLFDCFNIKELRELCFKLSIDYEEIPASTISEMTFELIRYCERRDRLDDLVRAASEARPDIDWDADKPFLKGPPIPWIEVKRICQEKNQNHERYLKPAYRSEKSLYVEREDLKKTVDKFLDSTANYLVLAGQSGMGKTAFMYHLKQKYKSDSKVACLAFDCKMLGEEQQPTATGLLDKLAIGILPHPNSGLIPDLLDRIEQGEGFDKNRHKLVILADAINEGQVIHGGKDDSLKTVATWLAYLQFPEPRSWVKVIITCRPHVWEPLIEFMMPEAPYSIPPESFYEFSQIDSGNLPVKEFSTEEVIRAYEMHQQAFELIPEPFDKLPTHVKNRLREPLILYLVSYICSKKDGKKAISELEKLGSDLEIIPTYVRERIRDHPSAGKTKSGLAESFLRNAISKKMISDSKCRYTIPRKELESGGKDKTLALLLKLGILQEIAGKGDEVSIGFRYERFYDYYFGYVLQERTQNGDETKCLPHEAD